MEPQIPLDKLFAVSDNGSFQEDKNAAKSSMRVLVNVGKAEVELLRATQEGSSALNPLARFMVGGLWVTYRMTYGGTKLACHLQCSSPLLCLLVGALDNLLL